MESNKKTLVLYPFNYKFHTVYDKTIEFFSKNYKLNYSPRKWSRFYKLKEIKLIRDSYYFVMGIFRKIWNIFNVRGGSVEPQESLLFSFNEIPPEEFDFIIELENVGGMAGYDYSKLDKGYISKRLGSEKCKGIICWNEIAYDELVRTIDCSKFEDKIHIIPFGGENFKLKEKSSEKIVFLFVGSINNPELFERKGGLIALEAFSRLSKKYKNIQFFVRAKIKKDIIDRYKNIQKITFLTDYLSEEKMKKLFSEADILFVPIPGIDLLIKSMEHGIPSVCFNYNVAGEMVQDKKTGFLIDSSSIFESKKDIEKYYKNLNKNYGMFYKKEFCMKFVPEFAEKGEILIKNKDLLKKMGKNQHKLVEEGEEYSLKRRNKKLSRLIDPHIK